MISVRIAIQGVLRMCLNFFFFNVFKNISELGTVKR